jgi:spermidine/putrescine-binding protein
MILRSAASSASLALIGMSPDLARAGIAAKVVVANLEPEEDLRQLFASLSELRPRDPAKELIRWARNPRLLDAHEQATYGAAMCWSGDAMRREADKRNALSLFDEAAPGTVRLAQLAFEALWSASAVVTERRLLAPAATKPSGAYERADESRVTAVSPLRPSLQGWPLVRH